MNKQLIIAALILGSLPVALALEQNRTISQLKAQMQTCQPPQCDTDTDCMEKHGGDGGPSVGGVRS